MVSGLFDCGAAAVGAGPRAGTAVVTVAVVLAAGIDDGVAAGTPDAPLAGGGTRSTLASPGTETRTGLAPVATNAAAPRHARRITAVKAPDGSRTERSAAFVRVDRADLIDRLWPTWSPITARDEAEGVRRAGGGGPASLRHQPLRLNVGHRNVRVAPLVQGDQLRAPQGADAVAVAQRRVDDEPHTHVVGTGRGSGERPHS